MTDAAGPAPPVCVLLERETVTMTASVPGSWSAATTTVPSRPAGTGTRRTTAARRGVPLTDNASRAGDPAPTAPSARAVRTGTTSAPTTA